jgi:hypothetical protein
MKTKLTLIAVFIAALWLASDIDKHMLLQDCVQQTDGSDMACDSCYYVIYGAYPTH